MRRSAEYKSKLMHLYPLDPIVRNNFYKSLKEYSKARKFKRKKYKQDLFDNLSNLKDKNPKAFWNVINELNNSDNNNFAKQIPLDTWYGYFSELNDASK